MDPDSTRFDPKKAVGAKTDLLSSYANVSCMDIEFIATCQGMGLVGISDELDSQTAAGVKQLKTIYHLTNAEGYEKLLLRA